MKLSWTQPICGECYAGLYGARTPVQVRDELRTIETCCMCERKTRAGIFVRLDPSKVPYPRGDS